MAVLGSFWKDEQCQDVVEYTIVMGVVAIATAAIFVCASGNIKSMWAVTTGHLDETGA